MHITLNHLLCVRKNIEMSYKPQKVSFVKVCFSSLKATLKDIPNPTLCGTKHFLFKLLLFTVVMMFFSALQGVSG